VPRPAGPPGSICIVLLTGLGDVVMGLPVANALRARFPAARITWVAEPTPSAALLHHPAIDDVIVYRKQRGWAGVRDLRRAMAARRFDVTLNLNVYFKSIWPTWFSRAPRRVGFDRDRARDGVWLFANDRLPARPRRHTLDMFLEFPEHLGVREPAVEWRLPITEEERRQQRAFFERLGERPVAAIVPASANARKDWLADRWAAVAGALEHDFGYRTLLVGGPGDRETAIAREISARTGGAPVWALGDGVRRLFWLLEGSDLVIAPDTGPVHVARAFEVPVIGLYGHTNPWRVGPYRKYQDLWVDRYTDAGETPDPGAFDPKWGRMEEITVEDVLDRVDRARERYRPGPGPRSRANPT
jgi:heptosyltransferase I